MTLRSKMSNRGTHHPVHSNDHEHVHQSSLERTHHLPKEGQLSMTHGGGKAFRGYLMSHTTDIDMNNARPVILSYICKINPMKHR